jgi:predicted RND superfamily exporter protein
VEALKPSYIAGGNSYTLKWLILCYVNFTSINNNNNDEKNYLVGETINSRKMQLMILSTWVLPVVIIVVIITIIWIIWL